MRYEYRKEGDLKKWIGSDNMSIGAEVVQSKYVLVGKYCYTTKRYCTVQNGFYT